MALEQGLGSPSIHTSIFELFCRYGKPLQVRVGAAHKHTDSRPVRSRRLMMLTPTYLSTSPSEECPRANHTLFEPLPWNSSLAPPHWDTWLWGHSPLCPPFAWHSNKAILVFSSVQFSRLVVSDPMNRSTPGLPVHHKLPEFTQTHVHRVVQTQQRTLKWLFY